MADIKITNMTLISVLQLFLFLFNFVRSDYSNENDAIQFLNDVNVNSTLQYMKMAEAEWNYSTNLTEANKNATLMEKAKSEPIAIAYWSEAIKYNLSALRDERVRRQFDKLSILGTAALPPNESAKFSSITADMESIYGSAKICISNECEIPLEPNITEIMAKERNECILKEAWVNWRDATGRKIRKMFTEYVNLGNKMAVKNSIGNHKFNNLGDMWTESYEDKNFREKVEKLWKEMEPFYKELHAFVRMKLRKKYWRIMPLDGTIPGHLLGNLWAQSWDNIMSEITPFPDLPQLDVTKAMVEKGYTPKSMFEMAEKFFVSLGLEPMTEKFWLKSMLEKPIDREVVCHASAWDFGDGSDYRVKMCTAVNMEDLITIHHELGHIEYYMLYKDQPMVFREGANPGFHEALGDLIALSVSTPGHLKKEGLLDNYVEDEKGVINYQLKMALEKIAFLPFAYLIDLWRWDVFANKITDKDYNRRWWELRLKYQGVSPPVIRNEDDFDPGCKYHVPGSVPYIRYFVSFIIQFQFHKSLCELSNQPVLHQCDISGNRQVGDKIRQVFSQGSSIPWQQQMMQLTNSSDMNAQPLLEYFKPLREFLKKELVNEKIGWSANVDNYVSNERKEHCT